MLARKIVITGATGNLGQKLRRHFDGCCGYELRLTCLNPANDRSVVTANLANPDAAWIDLFAGADAVVHLAANAQPFADWRSLVAPNIDGVLNVYAAAARHDVTRVIVASSVWSMYGYRDSGELINAELAPLPGAAYGATKLFAERVGHAYFANHAISGVAFRIGACMADENSANDVAGHDSWTQSCWLSNRDFCQGIEKALTADYRGFSILNLTSDIRPRRWDLAPAEALLGYRAQDSHVVILPRG